MDKKLVGVRFVVNFFACQCKFTNSSSVLDNVDQLMGKQNLNQIFGNPKSLVGQKWSKTSHTLDTSLGPYLCTRYYKKLLR
jgi:hypothetical protein